MNESAVSRRGFLGGAVVAGTAAALGGVLVDAEPGLGPAAEAAAVASSALPREASFAAAVGSTFGVRVGAATVPVTLRSVTTLDMANLPQHAVAGQQATTGEQFSLQFAGAAARSFRQGTYSMTNGTVGTFDLFVVPVGPAGATQAYQAVIVNV
jgi:hypothetical protein